MSLANISHLNGHVLNKSRICDCSDFMQKKVLILFQRE